MHILLAGDRRVHDAPMFPWLTFPHCMRPLDSAIAFDCNVMDAVAALASVVVHVALAACMVDTSLDRDVARADWVDSVADAFPACMNRKSLIILLLDVVDMVLLFENRFNLPAVGVPVEVDSSYFGWASAVVALVAYSSEVHLAHWAVAGQRIAYSVALGHCLAVEDLLDCVVAVVAS